MKTHKSRIDDTSQHMTLTIMVPVYNEERTIRTILESVTSLPIKEYEVIIVNDASKDASKDIIEQFDKDFASKNVRLRVISHPKNRGKGAAIKTALQHANGIYFVVQDADLEYNPKDIPRLLEVATQHQAEAVYGSRFIGDIHTMPKANYYANKFYNFLLRRLYKTSITDMHTCYKMIRTDLLRSFGLTSEGFDYATELVSKILRKGIRIREVPISFVGRSKKEGKKIDFRDGLECTYKLILYRVNADAR